jgi:hypothetical protein
VIALGAANSARQIGGSHNIVYASAGTGLTKPGLSRAFNYFGNNNEVVAGNVLNSADGGPGAISGAIGVSNHNGGTRITQTHFGIKIKTPLNP